MHVDRCVVQSKLTGIVQEYLLNIASLANHNHFRNRASDTRPLERGFYMFTHRNQHIIAEEQFLEGCTRVFLINSLIKMLLDLSGIQNDWRYGNTFGNYNITNREYELGSFVEFIFEKDGKNIGCRYTRSSYSSHEMATMEKDNTYLFGHKQVPGFDRLHYIDEVWCIDWVNDESASDKRDKKTSSRYD